MAAPAAAGAPRHPRGHRRGRRPSSPVPARWVNGQVRPRQRRHRLSRSCSPQPSRSSSPNNPLVHQEFSHEQGDRHHRRRFRLRRPHRPRTRPRRAHRLRRACATSPAATRTGSRRPRRTPPSTRWTCARSNWTSSPRSRPTPPSPRSSRRPARLDVVVHNAGHMVTGPTEAFTPEELAAVYDTNVLGTQRVNRAALPHLRAQGHGLVLWVGSTSTRGGTPPYLAPYFAAKAAMDSLAVSYAAELARFDIETTIVVPGSFTSGTNHFATGGHPAEQTVDPRLRGALRGPDGPGVPAPGRPRARRRGRVPGGRRDRRGRRHPARRAARSGSTSTRRTTAPRRSAWSRTASAPSS